MRQPADPAEGVVKFLTSYVLPFRELIFDGEVPHILCAPISVN